MGFAASMNWLELFLLAAATLFITETVTGKRGPFGIFEWLRLRTTLPDGKGGKRSNPLNCPWCLTPYIALALVLWIGWGRPLQSLVIETFAVSGLALMLRAYTGVRHG